MFERPSEGTSVMGRPIRRIGAHQPMKRDNGIVSSWAARIRALGASFECPPPCTLIAVVGESGRPRRGGAVGVLVQPSARDKFAPSELADAYEDFVASGPQYLDVESGIEGSV